MTTFLLTEPAYALLRDRLAPLAGRIEFLVYGEDKVLRADGQDVSPEHVQPECALISNDMFGTAHGGPFFELLGRLPSLKWVHSVGAGTDHPVFAALARNGAMLTTTHSQAVGMADYVLWGVLDHFQNGRARAEDQAAHRWERRQAREVMGTNWLVIGFGAIGQGVARRARGFGAHVTGVRRNTSPSPDADALVTPDGIMEHLPGADVVVCCVPQTPETLDLVDAGFLAAMKPGSVLVNVGRGSLIDDDALLAALDRGIPERAVLDVFRTEPLPAGHPYWDHPRVTVTPHNSGASYGVGERRDQLIADNIARYLGGEELLGMVSNDDVLAGAVKR